MRALFLLIFIFTLGLVYGQNVTLKVRKNTEGDKWLTLAGRDTGTVLLKQVLDNSSLTISKNENKIKIRHYDIIITDNNNETVYTGNGLNLPKNAMKKLKKVNSNNVIKISIFNVTAFDDSGNTIHLNDIRLNLLN